MVDMDPDERTFLRAVGEGVVGYVLKDASATEVADTIRAVFAGEAVCPPALSMTLFNVVQRRLSLPTPSRVLSRREQELVALLRERLTNKEIAARLNLSEQTVKNHVHRMMRKIGAPDRLASSSGASSKALVEEPQGNCSAELRKSFGESQHLRARSPCEH